MAEPIVCLTDVEWREVGDENTDKEHWIRNLTCPAEGEVRWVRLKSGGMLPDDTLKVGQNRWLLFEPNYAYFNGFHQDENTQELDLCAVVEVELLQVFLPVAPTKYEVPRSWAQCRCLQTVLLAQIPSVFPPMFGAKRASNLSAVRGRTITHFAERTPEVYYWYNVTNPATTPYALPHLVLMGLSLDSYCYICNWIVECDKTSWTAS